MKNKIIYSEPSGYFPKEIMEKYFTDTIESEENNKPQVRFKGFTDAWVSYKLGSRLTKNNEKNRDLSISNVESVSNKKGFIKQTEQFEDYTVASSDLSNYYVIHEKMFAYNPSRINVGSIAYKNIGDSSAVVSPLYVSFSTNNIDDKYLWYWFKTSEFERQRHAVSEGGVRDTLSYDKIADMCIELPSMKEQESISTYFKNLDTLITLHQRKCDTLKKLKKAMLQKMFPQNNSKYPEVRFKGFTNAWEQRELGEVFTQTSKFVNPKEDDIELWSLTVEEGLTPKSERYTRDFLVKKEDNFKEVRVGDIVYNPMNMTLGAIGYNNMSKNIAVSGYYVTMFANSNTDSYFINTWMKSPQAILTYKNYATGSLKEKQRVQFSTLSLIAVSFPTLEEQKQIGDYFRNLDTLITLHQRKYDTLKKLKKAMLQKMFI